MAGNFKKESLSTTLSRSYIVFALAIIKLYYIIPRPFLRTLKFHATRDVKKKIHILEFFPCFVQKKIQHHYSDQTFVISMNLYIV